MAGTHTPAAAVVYGCLCTAVPPCPHRCPGHDSPITTAVAAPPHADAKPHDCGFIRCPSYGIQPLLISETS